MCVFPSPFISRGFHAPHSIQLYTQCPSLPGTVPVVVNDGGGDGFGDVTNPTIRFLDPGNNPSHGGGIVIGGPGGNILMGGGGGAGPNGVNLMNDGRPPPPPPHTNLLHMAGKLF